MKRALVLLLAGMLAGCANKPPPSAPAAATPPAAAQAAPLHLARTSFTALPDWQDADLAAARDAFRRGCAVLSARAADAAMGGAGYAGTAGDWRAACADPAADARAFFESNFTPYAVSPAEDGLFTGYYEPLIEAAPARGGVYQTPIYALPSDLVQVNLGLFNSKYAGERISGRIEGRVLVPYDSRAQINARPPQAEVVLWAADPVALFFLQIQGSGRARLPDGRMVRLSYAGGNGQPYTAIGRTLIAEGALARENVSLQSIRAWLAAHPGQAQRVMETDKSYVFFARQDLAADVPGPNGTLGVALTPRGSLAIDPRLNALGAPFYLASSATPTNPAHRLLLIGQDTGGAIRGAVRGDIFFGFGAQAEERAGHMNAPGKLFVLLPNALAARLGQEWRAP